MSRLHRPRAGFWVRLCVLIIVPVDTLLFRMRWRHLERIPAPEQGGVLIAVNHVSMLDTVLTALCVWQAGRIPRFMIKAPVFRWPIIGPMMRGAAQIPVHRGTADASASLHEVLAALGRGEAVIIYPEGTTTKDPQNWPMLARTGIARLVLLSPDTPVVPIGQWGAQRNRRLSWRRLGRRRLAQASVGEPLDLRRFRGLPPSAATLREITDVIMTAVRDEVAQLRNEPAPRTFFVPTRRYVDKR